MQPADCSYIAMTVCLAMQQKGPLLQLVFQYYVSAGEV